MVTSAKTPIIEYKTARERPMFEFIFDTKKFAARNAAGNAESSKYLCPSPKKRSLGIQIVTSARIYENTTHKVKSEKIGFVGNSNIKMYKVNKTQGLVISKTNGGN